MTQTTAAATDPEFPFLAQINLQPLLKLWRVEEPCHPLVSQLSREIEAMQTAYPELFKPQLSTGALQERAEIVKLLLSPVLSCSESRRNLMAVIRPYHFEIIYATPAFRDQLLDANGNLRVEAKMGPAQTRFGRALAAYTEIARQYYGLDFAFDANLIFRASSADGAVNRYYQFDFDCNFLQVVALKKPPKLSSEQIEQLSNNISDLQLWQRLIPPQNFELHGVVIIQASDVTQLEVYSDLNRAMSSGTQLISGKGMRMLTQGARDITQDSSLDLRLISAQGDKAFMVKSGCQGYSGCLISNSQHFECSDLSGSIYEQAAKSRKFTVVRDTADLAKDNIMHRHLTDDAVRSLVLFPLQDGDKIVGILEIDFPETGAGHANFELKLSELASITAMGLKQSRQFLEQSVSAIIQQKCSVIHPAVEWRFRQAAFNMITGKSPGELEEIVFRQVYPLFGETDIKNSSVFRNQAIQADLSTQLTLARTVLQSAIEIKPMPILDEMSFRIEQYLNHLEQGLRSGDELSMDQFFKMELEPMFDELARLDDSISEAIQNYRKRLDPRFGALYDERRDYEESVLRINGHISQFLEQEEQRAQQMFPHYFETTATDGVEMMIYLGASMAEDGNFDLFHLRNLRLWQLHTTCRIARLCEELKPKLKLPLETTHLILVQDIPLSIRFSETEKNFIVDGAYNIRYEIMKKRIDKAMVNQASERLTQPGKIAIVYSHIKEAQEYRRYIEYLQYQGFLLDEVQDLELEALQGLQGLRALRVSVNLDPAEPTPGSLAGTTLERVAALS